MRLDPQRRPKRRPTGTATRRLPLVQTLSGWCNAVSKSNSIGCSKNTLEEWWKWDLLGHSSNMKRKKNVHWLLRHLGSDTSRFWGNDNHNMPYFGTWGYRWSPSIIGHSPYQRLNFRSAKWRFHQRTPLCDRPNFPVDLLLQKQCFPGQHFWNPLRMSEKCWHLTAQKHPRMTCLSAHKFGHVFLYQTTQYCRKSIRLHGQQRGNEQVLDNQAYHE